MTIDGRDVDAFIDLLDDLEVVTDLDADRDCDGYVVVYMDAICDPPLSDVVGIWTNPVDALAFAAEAEAQINDGDRPPCRCIVTRIFKR